jgi:NAD(P)-dependent dehydrogenase (short-subunit alcohol dehydrogenase family)
MNEGTGEGGWAVILGGSSGVGAAISEAVAASPGLNVFGVHRGNWPEEAAEVAETVGARGRRCVHWVADASKESAAEDGARRLLDAAGPRSVKCFVHSIASASVGLLAAGDEPVAPKQIRATFERMAHSFLYWVQALRRHDLLAESAQLLALGNPMPDAVVRNAGLIAASKAALEQYVRHLAFELGPLGHRVNLLKFGLVVTPAVRRTFPGDALAALTNTVSATLPARRLATMDEVARFCAYLASDEGVWFNGATIDFTGAESQAFFDALVYKNEPLS